MSLIMTGPCPVAADNAFGPIIHGCDHTDFTLLFEQSILSIGPSALLLCIAPLRTFSLRHQPIKILRHRGFFSKLTVLVLLAAVELASLIHWAVKARIRTDASIAAAILSFISSVALVALSYAEHTRSVQPSAIINFYLAFSFIFDVPQARTLFSRKAPEGIATLFVCAMVLKAFALLLEAQNKRRYLMAPYSNYSPEALSSIINRSFQWWVNPLFVRGFRGLLSVDQLFPSDKKLSSEKLSRTSTQLWAKAKDQDNKHPLRRMLASQLKYQLASTMVPRICLVAFKFCQPLLINRVTSLLSSSNQNNDYNNFLIAATALIYGGLATCTSLYHVQLNRTKTMTRGILVSSIFDKALDGSEPGNKSLTLMTNDTGRITGYMERLIDGIAGSLIEIIVALALLAQQIGWVCIVPIILCALASAWGFWNSGAAAPLQRAWMTASQDRISFTAKVLAFPKALKMLGLTEIFQEQIQEHRFKETELSKPMTRFGVMRNVIGHAPQMWAPPVTLTIAVLVQSHGHLDVQKAFTTLSIIALLTSPVEQFVQSIPILGSAAALLDRIEDFLMTEKKGPTVYVSVESLGNDTELHDISLPLSAGDNAVKFEDASFGYKADEAIVRGISTRLSPRTLNIVYGPVGCGKSTFLRALIGELTPINGSISRATKEIAYCAQETWLPNLSVQDIITMETEPDSTWYNTIIEACNLSIDIRRLPNGNDTLVGSKGVQLSGGQRQRISLARALYSRNSILVADDILSGLDSVTSGRAFNQVFGPDGICKKHGITSVLATHNKRFASSADRIIMLGPDGTIVSQGSYETVNKHLQAAILATNALTSEIDDLVNTSETKSHAKDIDSEAEQDLKRKTGDFTLYTYYIKTIGLLSGMLFVVPACLFTFCLGFPSMWLKFWAEDENASNNAMYIGVYFVLAVGSSILGGLAMLQFTSVIVPASSRHLHNFLLNAVLRAPYSYFASTDTGVILNRFSQDMLMIDTSLSGSAFMATLFVLQTIMEGALIISGSIYLAAILPAVLVALYGIQYFYLRTSRQLRFLELETQAPLQTHFLESIDGVATIRAFGWQEKARAKNWKILDLSQRPFYLLLCAQVWLALVLDLVVAVIAILIVTVALNTTRGTSAGAVGVSMFGVLSFSGTLTNLIEAWTGLETSLGAVARVKNFVASTESEDKAVSDTTQLLQDWPTGRVDFNMMTASYNATSDPVLVDFDLHIKPGEKIGICGRSGSGKSSVLLALFRMLEVSPGGSLAIDGLDIAQVPSTALRSHLNVVIQEPVLLPGSLRFNIDPLVKASDYEIVAVLEKVGLWTVLQNREGGLEAPLEQNSLSVGQQQLLNVARAMLKKTKILVLDESTSSVDSVTEAKIIQLVKDEFSACTVIAVAHRLNTLRDFDRVVVLDSGRMVEVGSPEELLASDSTFKTMYERSS